MDLVISGNLRPTLRSAPQPLHNVGPLRVVVAATFDEIVLRSEADVLLLVTASWCGECAPAVEMVRRLAQLWQEERGLIVGVFDAAANDLPRALNVDKLPSIILFTSASRSASGDASGDATGSATGGAAGGATGTSSAGSDGGGGDDGGQEGALLSDAPSHALGGRVPYDLSEIETESALSDAIMRYSSVPLTKPADVSQLQQALELLPRFRQEAQALLSENQRLRAELTEARHQLLTLSATGTPPQD